MAKLHRISLWLVISTLCTFVPHLRAQARTDTGTNASITDEGVAIDAVLNQVQAALAQVQTTLQRQNIPPLESVVLTLETQYDAKGGPKLKFFVFSFGATWERQRSNQIVLTLKPPKPGTATQMGRTPGISDQLVEALTSAAEGIQASRQRTPPLVLDSLKTVIQFVVLTDITGQVDFQIVPVGVELKGDLSKKAIHSISVNYATEKPLDKPK